MPRAALIHQHDIACLVQAGEIGQDEGERLDGGLAGAARQHEDGVGHGRVLGGNNGEVDGEGAAVWLVSIFGHGDGAAVGIHIAHQSAWLEGGAGGFCGGCATGGQKDGREEQKQKFNFHSIWKQGYFFFCG